jgi:hypothetical protein
MQAMGIYDRDWYKQAHGKRPSAPPPGFLPPRRAPAGILSLVLLWLLIGGAITLMVRALVPGFGPVQVRAAQAGAVLLSPNRSGNYTLGGGDQRRAGHLHGRHRGFYLGGIRCGC